MGGSILSKHRHIDETSGKTIIDNKVSTLILAADRDGLYRISKNAESYYHLKKNINKNQAKKFAVFVLKGLNHASFLDSKYTSSFVTNNDLFSTVSQDQGYMMVIDRMLAYITV